MDASIVDLATARARRRRPPSETWNRRPSVDALHLARGAMLVPAVIALGCVAVYVGMVWWALPGARK